MQYSNSDMLKQLIKLFEKYEITMKNESALNLSGTSYSEVHTLDLIGRTEMPNVKFLSEEMRFTKGAISKITKKLMDRGFITSFKKEDNKKEIYFRLTESGNIVFEKHKTFHEEGIERDQEIFTDFNESEREVILKFMNKVIENLEERG